MAFQLKKSVEILTQTPITLKSLLRGLSDFWIVPNEGANTWSPYNVVAHLVYIEETAWISRINIILEHGESQTLPDVDRFAFFEKSKGKTLDELLDSFQAVRIDNIQVLKGMNLTAQELMMKGTHPQFGSVTRAELLATWTIHDLTHIRQIARVMAKQYTDAVGPWKAILSILRE